MGPGTGLEGMYSVLAGWNYLSDLTVVMSPPFTICARSYKCGSPQCRSMAAQPLDPALDQTLMKHRNQAVSGIISIGKVHFYVVAFALEYTSDGRSFQDAGSLGSVGGTPPLLIFL